MHEVLLVRAETVSALGDTRSDTWKRLLAGESAAAPITHFDSAPYYCRSAATIADIAPESEDSSRLIKLLKKLFKTLPNSLPVSCRLIGSTLKGAIDQQEKIWRKAELSNPDNLPPEKPQPLPWTSAKLIADHFSINQPGLTINAACASSTIALSRAASRIAAGFDDCILVWGAEIIPEFVFAGFASIKALTPDCCRPFDQKRNGLILGEGAAALLLMSAEKAEETGSKPLARISGWGIANDAVHLTAPAADGHGLHTACRRALQRATLKPEDIAAINAHGTATIHNDKMEIATFTELFRKSGKHKKIPLHTVKGALGHTLGAAGALETAIAINSLQEQRLPPTVGLIQPETAICNQVSSKIQPFSGDNLLLTNSGFGGVNAALILQRVGL
jgi:3-oxoacyl-[acyl-carrier-protein] synthase II